MTYDAIVVGAGVGGLYAAANLPAPVRMSSSSKITPYRRNELSFSAAAAYSFPMGPLAFGYPGRV